MTQLELEVNIDEPIDENSAHAISDISLRGHVIGTWLIFDFELAQVLVYVLDVLHDVVGLIAIGSINVKDRHSRSNLTTEETFKTTYKSIAFTRTSAES
jgi:hypothetical protein